MTLTTNQSSFPDLPDLLEYQGLLEKKEILELKVLLAMLGNLDPKGLLEIRVPLAIPERKEPLATTEPLEPMVSKELDRRENLDTMVHLAFLELLAHPEKMVILVALDPQDLKEILAHQVTQFHQRSLGLLAHLV